MTDTYQPTKARGPIAAMFASPGPRYALPSNTGTTQHDIRKKKAPAYSFGVRHRKFTDDCSPGPRYLVDPRISRFGSNGEPHYSLYSRPIDPQQFSTPGPGNYSPEKAGKSAKFSAPAYSFGGRTRGSKFDKCPGKWCYLWNKLLWYHWNCFLPCVRRDTINMLTQPSYLLLRNVKLWRCLLL